MDSPNEIPNFRKFDWRAAVRTALYTAITLACLMTGNVPGLGLLVLLREGRRYWIRRSRIPVAKALHHDYATKGGQQELLARVASSVVGRVMLYELIGLILVSLVGLGWYLWSPWGAWWR